MGRLTSEKVWIASLLASVCACAPIQTEDQAAALVGANLAIVNPGFENGFAGWTQAEPAAISTSDRHSGVKSAKLSGASSACSQKIVGLTPGTSYVLRAWLLGAGQIGARGYGNQEVSSEVSADTWTPATISFTTGPSSTTAEIFAAWMAGGDLHVDDFSLTTSASGSALPIAAVRDSGNDGHMASNTFDEQLSTRWSSNGNGQWIEWDLGVVANISSLQIAFYQGSTRKSTFDLYVSDGTNSTLVLSKAQSSGATDDFEPIALSSVSGRQVRYVRYVGYGNSSSSWNSLSEVQIFGATDSSSTGEDGGVTAPADAALPQVDAAQPSTDATSVPSDASFAVSFGSCPLPFQTNPSVLDPSTWYITLPVGAPTTYGPPIPLNGLKGSDSTYFYPTESEGTLASVTFYAPYGSGSATTANSSYVRSELREVATDSQRINGSGDWNLVTAKRTLFASLRVDSVNQGSAGKGLIIGQIHRSQHRW